MKLIGKGTFTKCYLLPCKKKVLLKTDDPVKECMGNSWFPNSRLFPKLKTTDEGYISKYYPRVKSLKDSLEPKEYEKYTELRKLWRDNDHSITNYYTCIEVFKTVKNKAMKKALLEAVNSLANYGSDICFEISPRNVAVNNGKLILLDCFFMESKLNETRNKNKLY